MKEGAIKYVLGIILTGFSLVSSLLHLFKYIRDERNISDAYSYSFILVYISIPIVLLCLVIFAISIFERNKLNSAKIFRYLYLIHLIVLISIYLFFDFESNKLLITIRNYSEYTIENLEFNARNKQHFNLNSLKSGESDGFICHCRKITFNDSIGVEINFNLTNFPHKNLSVISSNRPFYDQQMEILVINDSLTVLKYNNFDLWERLDKYSPLLKTEEIKKVIESGNR